MSFINLEAKKINSKNLSKESHNMIIFNFMNNKARPSLRSIHPDLAFYSLPDLAFLRFGLSTKVKTRMRRIIKIAEAKLVNRRNLKPTEI